MVSPESDLRGGITDDAGGAGRSGFYVGYARLGTSRESGKPPGSLFMLSFNSQPPAEAT